MLARNTRTKGAKVDWQDQQTGLELAQQRLTWVAVSGTKCPNSGILITKIVELVQRCWRPISETRHAFVIDSRGRRTQGMNLISFVITHQPMGGRSIC